MCDDCHKPLNDGEVLVCGHGYHHSCYATMEYCCHHCKEYFKKGIYYNVESFIKRLKKGPNTLTNEEKREREQEKEEQESEQDDDVAEEVKIEKSNAFLMALNAVNGW